jgi:hypothetical protein
MTQLEAWVNDATRCLSRDSASRVRSEIQDHYRSAREAALTGGVIPEEADRSALLALGDPRTANREYRKVMLTSSEAKLLREGNWEASHFCSWMKWALLALPVGAFIAAPLLFLAERPHEARLFLAMGLAFGLFFTAPFLPIYTPSRSKIYRTIKWVVGLGALVLAFGPNALKYSWLLASCVWPVYWIERSRISIRRKLPVEQWPKQLYL